MIHLIETHTSWSLILEWFYNSYFNSQIIFFNTFQIIWRNDWKWIHHLPLSSMLITATVPSLMTLCVAELAWLLILNSELPFAGTCPNNVGWEVKFFTTLSFSSGVGTGIFSLILMLDSELCKNHTVINEREMNRNSIKIDNFNRKSICRYAYIE